MKLESSEELEGFEEIQDEDKELIQKLIEKSGKNGTEKFRIHFSSTFCLSR